MIWIALLVALVGLQPQTIHEVAALVPPGLTALTRRHPAISAAFPASNVGRVLSLSSKNDDDNPKQKGDYKDKLAELDEQIAQAEEERQKLLRAELDRYEQKSNNKDDISEKEEPNEKLVPVEEWTPRELKKPPPPSTTRTIPTRSKFQRTDAGTLVIDITPQGITSGVVFNGVFSVAWFSAIVPATVAALSGAGLLTGLFLLPFWAAGGLVAKQAVVDPFVSNQLTIGEYAWTVESRYAIQIQQVEGSTQNLQGAKVECPLVVNNVPQYQLNLYDSSKGVTTLGQGLPMEELEKVATEINQYLDSLPTTKEDNNKESLPGGT